MDNGRRLAICISFLLQGISTFAAHHLQKTKQHLINDRSSYIGFVMGKDVPTIKLKVPPKLNSFLMPGFILNKPITTRINIEAGLQTTMQTVQPSIATPNYKLYKKFKMPITLQYNMLPKTCKLQPYFGAGILCTSNNGAALTNLNSSVESQQNSNNTKYITILLTQGFIYQVSTKLQILESVHFQNITSTNSTITINVGVGFRLP